MNTIRLHNSLHEVSAAIQTEKQSPSIEVSKLLKNVKAHEMTELDQILSLVRYAYNPEAKINESEKLKYVYTALAKKHNLNF